MGSKINPTMIGAFVVSAIVLMVAGVLLFGGGKFFQEKLPYVLFFDSTVEGLNVGAPVIFRGVQVGQVTEISALADPQTFDVRIRVKVEIMRGVVKVVGAEDQLFGDSPQEVEGLIRKGARTTLRMQSFVTGVLYVAIDFFPDTPIRLLGLDPTLPELPTIPSDMDQLKSNIQQALGELRKLPLEAILAEALTVLKRAGALLDAPELKQALVALRDVMTDTRQLVANADHEVGALGPKLAGTADVASKALETLRVTLLDAQKLVRDLDGQVAPLAGGAKETLTIAKDTLTAARSTLGQGQKSLATLTEAAIPVLKQADKTLAGTTTLTGPDSAVLNDLSHTLRSLDEAARAIRTLASTLERNPEMLIRGRSK
jgi:phospholipid/cholesterol/gamma-HCH transport system substrate-binding protein